MSDNSVNGVTRREFLGRAAMFAGAAPFVPGVLAVPPLVNTAPAERYRFLAPREAAFTEALVNALCPADELTPDGVTCGLAELIDHQLAGEFGAQPSEHSLMSKGQFFESGVAAANRASRVRFGVPLSRLPPPEARVFLAQIAYGRVPDTEVPLAIWYKEIVDPLLVQASFSGSIYQTYGNRVFTKLF